MKLRGRDVLSRAECRRQLFELNAAYDGPGPVVVKYRPIRNKGEPSAYLGAPPEERFDEFVVEIPGDGRKFPVASFVEALLASEVFEIPY